MKPLDALRSVLCDPEGKVSTWMPTADALTVQDALDTLAKAPKVTATAYEGRTPKNITGTFHGFTTVAMEYEAGFCPDAVALVEDDADGQMYMVCPQHMRFLR